MLLKRSKKEEFKGYIYLTWCRKEPVPRKAMELHICMSKEKKINLLYVITKLELGGAQKYLLAQIRGVDKDKFNLFLFTARDGLLVDQALSIPGLSFYRSRFLKRRINPIEDFLAFIEIFLYIIKNNIRIIHTHSSKAGILGRLAARAAGVKVVIHNVHGWSFHGHQPKIYYYLCVLLEKFCAEFTNMLVVVSEWDKKRGLDHHIIPRDGYAVIRFGIDHDEFNNRWQRNEVRRNIGLIGNGPVIGMVACFKPQKAPLDFIRLAVALKKVLPQCKFVLVGDGPLRRKIALSITDAALEKDVILTGWRQDMPDILSALDVCVLTSLWEGLPIAVMEAMAARVPVVATDTGGIREVVLPGDTGYLVKVGDIADLSNRVLELLTDSGLRTRLAERAAHFIKDEKFSLNHMIKSTEDIYLSSWARVADV